MYWHVVNVFAAHGEELYRIGPGTEIETDAGGSMKANSH